MTESRLNGFCLLSVHQKLVLEKKAEIELAVVEKFSANPRRLMSSGSTCWSTPYDHKVMKIQKATSEDPVCNSLSFYIKNGWPNSIKRVQPIVQHYHRFPNELTEYIGPIYKGDKIIIPSKCRPDLLSKLYYGHFGVNETNNRSRQCFYWPGMARDLEEIVLSCHICMTHRKNNSREPLIPHDIPNCPWKKVVEMHTC
ncbi:hypothetical protein ILUMI_08804 [Ignelater luminosus]|uniref:RNA-directed DNA polymerase n=1 Tax=Ignelater luminosus TaxID=2038154 RepID=A0A8K0DAK5_IGNLU|nr:hypothetical protein ILUMI_08804 [Ignelater luminosus]